MKESSLLALSLSSLLFVACGGGSPPAATPAAAEPAASSSASPSLGGASAAAPASSASAPESKPAEAAAKPAGAADKRSPREVVELKDTVFFLAFEDSDPKKEAEASCTKSSGKDAKRVAACMSKARDEATAEGYRFEQDKGGDWWWLVVRRKGNALTTIHRVRFSYGEETPTTIVIKPEGKDMGSKPWKKGAPEMKFEVPTDYRLIVHDPQHGKLVYEAKSGIGSSGGK